MNVWGLIDGTARFPARPVRYADSSHPIMIGWYEGDVPCCGRCGCAVEPLAVRGGIATGWKHLETPR